MMTKTMTNPTIKRYISKVLAVLFIFMLLCHGLALKADAAVTVATAKNAGSLIAAGGEHSMALKADGTVAAWGDNSDGQCDVPSGLTNVAAISAGYWYCMALKADGTVVAWGGGSACNVPSGLTDAVAIAAGGYHSMALKTDGTVVAWGYNAYGQSNVPSGLTNVVAIAAGVNHSLALKADGTVVAWGDNTYGQCNVPSGLTNVAAISAGEYHSLVLKSDGTVVAWGGGSACNVPSGLTDAVAIAAGGYHSMALKTDGTVVAWGYNYNGQCDVPSGLTNVAAISAGVNHSLALKVDGTVVAWGINYDGQSNVPSGLNLCSLSDLLVNDGQKSLGFDPEVSSYTLEVSNLDGSIDLSPFAYSGTQIEVQGAVKASGSTTRLTVNLGENIFTVSAINSAAGLVHTYTLTVNRALPDSANANLYTLRTGIGVLTPAFDKDTTDYTVNVGNMIGSIDIIAFPEDMSATATVNGQSVSAMNQTATVPLAVGDNVISVQVRAGDMTTTKEYTVTVIRGLSDNADLTSLSVGTGSLSPAFDPDKVAYAVQGAATINSIDITAVTAETGATMTIGGQTALSGVPVPVPLDNGANLIPVVITAPDGATQKSYIISVNGTVSNADLGALTLSAGTLNFSAAVTSYYVTVGSDVTSVDLTASASDGKAVMLLDGAILSQGGSANIPLSVGDNTVTLMVIAQDATTKTYTVTINRGSSDATLSGLSLSNGTLSPAFNQTTYAYTATVAYSVTDLTVTPTPSDAAATVTVNGQSPATPVNLSVGGNTVTIVVTGADGVTTKTYTIAVTRQAAVTITNAKLPVGIIGGAYSVTMAAAGGNGAFAWNAVGLPASNSLSLDSTTGVLSGTPLSGDEGTYTVTITAADTNLVTGTETYTLVIHLGCGGGAYLIVSDGDPAYTGSYTGDGIPTLTVNPGVSGFTYFGVDISAVTGHPGTEICIFVHTRNGVQLGIMGFADDFDGGGTVRASFNVKPGDVIKVYIVDALSNGAAGNPNVL